MYKFGRVQKKVLLALGGGLLLGLSSSPRQYYRNLKLLRQEWRRIGQSNFNRTIRHLAREKLIEEQHLPDGSCKLILTKKGQWQAKRLDLLGNSIKFKAPKKWDRKWRIVLFDIPEKDRMFRDILREHLKELKFRKLQNSVFVSPHPFEKPILELVGLYEAQAYVRVITAEKIDNETKLEKYFFKK